MRHSFSIARLLAAVLAVSACSSAFAEASYPETFRLVRSMREDELLMEGVHVKSARQLEANKADTRAACLVKAKYPAITDAIAVVISSDLTDAEVAEAIAFYRGPVGRKHIAQRFQSITEKPPASSATFTAQEQAIFDKFSKRPVGRKLLKERIAQQKAVMQKIDQRLDLEVDDCSYESESGQAPDGGVMYAKTTCATVPLASPDNDCSVLQEMVEYPEPAPETATSIRVDCATAGIGGILLRYKGKVDGIGLKWLGNRVLEVSAPRGASVQWMDRPRNFRVQLKEIPAGGKTQCVARSNSSTARMNELQAQSFWMAYGDADRCTLSKRMQTTSSPRERPWLVQFQRVKSSELPFGTPRLVFFESFSNEVHTTSVRLRGAGTESLKMTPGGAMAGFHLIGAPAEELAKKLAAGGEVTLDVKPATGAAFSVPLTRNDFDWAHQEFASCLRSL